MQDKKLMIEIFRRIHALGGRGVLRGCADGTDGPLL